MKVAYIQPIGGVSGDMLLASFMHLGLNISKLNNIRLMCKNIFTKAKYRKNICVNSNLRKS